MAAASEGGASGGEINVKERRHRENEEENE